jgi:ATP-dependent helicase YprA (DUF1998 family)
MAGYAGSIASTWQRAGRAGTRADITVLSCTGQPLAGFVAGRGNACGRAGTRDNL